MKKDIFIDNNIACKFSNPQDKHYIELTKWLLHFGENKDDAYLVVSKKLLQEYYSSARNSFSSSSIPIIIDTMTKQNRLITVSNDVIRDFKSKHFSKKILSSLQCNLKDRDHIPLICTSDRRYALSYDNNFISDLKSFPGFTILVEKRPEKLPYK